MIEYKRLDSLDLNFESDFSEFENVFYEILSKSYPVYYGKDYHKNRIQNGGAIIYLGFVNKVLVAASYVKRNMRRGGTAVFPEKYRRLGLAARLVELSLKDFPKQYTILSTNYDHSHKMLSLMEKLGFRMANDEKQVKEIVGNEFFLLSNFRFHNTYFVFDRESERRTTKRDFLTLLHTY